MSLIKVEIVYTITVNKTIPLNKKGHCVAWKLLVYLKLSACYCRPVLICAAFEQERLQELGPRARHLFVGRRNPAVAGRASSRHMQGHLDRVNGILLHSTMLRGGGKSQSLCMWEPRDSIRAPDPVKQF